MFTVGCAQTIIESPLCVNCTCGLPTHDSLVRPFRFYTAFFANFLSFLQESDFGIDALLVSPKRPYRSLMKHRVSEMSDHLAVEETLSAKSKSK